jgi:ATP-dependent helicase/nuclease subunit A
MLIKIWFWMKVRDQAMTEKKVVSPLPDEKDRNKASASNGASQGLGLNVFIEAGAGTGKTETIVRRIVNQLYADPTLTLANVAAITFTEKAGAELRSRFRKILADDIKVPNEIDVQRAKELLKNVDSAAIGTIHSFAKSILTEHSLSADLPVGFQIANEDSGQSLRIDRCRRVVSKVYAGLSEAGRLAFDEIEFYTKNMQDMAEAIDLKFTRIASKLVFSKNDATEPYQVAAINFLEACRDALIEELTVRQKNGQVEFDDLLILTERLLQDNDEVRSIVHGKYRILVVDEFQDTDPVQWEIVKLVTSSPSDLANGPVPGRLVVVGDPKQAIYAFRGGDIRTYLAAKKQFPAFGEILELKANFRSVPGVIDFVNDAFADSLAGGKNPLNMGVPYSPLANIHDPEHGDPGPAVTLLTNPADISEVGPEYEMTQTACAIRQAIEEKWQVTDRGQAMGWQRVYKREANYGDVCVLVPVRTHLNILLRKFEEIGVPYRSSDPAIVYKRPIIAGILDAISVVSKSDDMAKLWGALKSPLFGFSDAELLEHKTSEGKWFVNDKPEGGTEEVNAALSYLYLLSKKRAAQNPAWLIAELVKAQSIFETLTKDSQGEFEASCIRMVIAHSQQWLSEGNFGLLNYLNWVNTMLGESTRATLPQPEEPNTNSVQIMTIHASKGLEFAITVVTGMAGIIKADRPKLLFRAPDNAGEDTLVEFYLKKQGNKNCESKGYEYLLMNGEFVSSMEELNRLIYVACTRAKDHLILSAISKPISKEEQRTGKPSRAPSRGRRVWQASEYFNESNRELFDGTVFEDVAAVTSGVEYRKPTQSDADGLQSAIAKSAEQIMRSPSSKEHDVVSKVEFNSTKSMGLAQRDGRPMGRAVHGILDLVMRSSSIPSPAVIEEFVLRLVGQEQAEDQIGEIRERVAKLLENAEVKEALATEFRWPELQLAMKVEGESIRYVEGFADLVYKSSAGYVLVDYKTDGDLEASMDHYKEQLGAYAEIIEKITGEKLAKVLLIHARTDEAATVELKY